MARMSAVSVSSRAPMADVIACRNLRKYFADVKAVDGLDLSVAAANVSACSGRTARARRRRSRSSKG